jgi:hypothetical protein
VPQIVALAVGAALIVEIEDFSVLVEIGDVEDVGIADAQLRRGPAVPAVHWRRDFERTVERRKGGLLVVIQILAGQNRDRIVVHRAFDVALRCGVDPRGEVDTRQLRDEQRV